MKEHTKKAFGLFGLVLVAAMTIVAALLPVPGAIAQTSNVTDTIVVRVVGKSPNVEFTDPLDDEVTLNPIQTFPFIYENVKTVTITMEYTDLDGNTHTYTLEDIDADYEVGSGVLNLDLNDPNYGYGDYVIKITGDHDVVTPDEDIIAFSYLPFNATVEEDDDTDNANLTLEYDENSDIEKFVVVVYDEDGNIVDKIPTQTIDSPNKSGVIPFGDNKVPTGTYTIKITAYDENGAIYTITRIYKHESTLVPNTGGVFGGFDISKTDYLITGLIIFALVGVGGLAIIIKSNKKSRNRR